MAPTTTAKQRQHKDINSRARFRHLTSYTTLLGASAVIIHAASSLYCKTPMHTSILSGQGWVNELLNGHELRFSNQFAMEKFVFKRLIATLRKKAGWGGSKHVSAEEKLAIFLYACTTGLSNRKLQERFQCSADTISKAFHSMLNALTSEGVYGAFVKLPDPMVTPRELRQDPKFYPYFKDCIGAIDGSHIEATVLADLSASCRNRKGDITQNVLAACGFDMQFVYVLPGWEGSAADSMIFQDAWTQDFVVPHGKYYLGDAGFPGCDDCVVPYRGVRYHLKEWGRSSQKPANAKELFNLWHASARNVIERTFGVFKARYKILDSGPSYPFEVQARLVAGLSVVHNFIGIHDPSDTRNVQKNLNEDQLRCNGPCPEPAPLDRIAPGIT